MAKGEGHKDRESEGERGTSVYFTGGHNGPLNERLSVGGRAAAKYGPM